MTFRRVDIGEHRLAAVPDLARRQPNLRWVRIDRLAIDDDYQRPLGSSNWKAITRIAENFTWSHFSPLIVAPLPDAHFAIIDGQHRAHAALMRGIAEAPALVVDLDLSARARAFAAINGQVTAIGPHHVYRAALVAGEPWALAAQAAVAMAGCRLMTFVGASAQKRAADIYCVGFIRDHIEAGRGPLLTLALSSLRASKAEADMRAWSFPFLSAWIAALIAVPRAQRRNLTEFIDAHPPAALFQGVTLLRLKPDYAHRAAKGLMADILREQLSRWVENGHGVLR